MSLRDHLPEGFEFPGEPCDRVEFWQPFWSASITPWDLGRPHPELLARLALFGEPCPTYVPGCGRGHDALALAEAGHKVTAVDFCAGVEEALAARLESLQSRFLRRDALLLEPDDRYGLWWDHTFLCAIPLESRPRWAEALLTALADGGMLAALVFPTGKPIEEDGPPFRLRTEHIRDLLGSRARLVLDDDCIAPARDGGERFALFEILPR